MRNLAHSDKYFRDLVHSVANFSADYLDNLPALPTFPTDVSADEVNSALGTELPRQGLGPAAFDLLPQIFHFSRPPSPRFFGYVYGSGEAVGCVGTLAASVLHQNVTAWRSAPAAVTIERRVVRWLAQAIGCHGFSGSLTSGGSSANLMALCMAREAKLPANRRGAQGGVIYCSTEAHMSIIKAAALLGIGRDAVRYIPVDGQFRMRTDLLCEAIAKDLQDGLSPLAVIASAGTTATGSIDPLNSVADICHEFALWMHVDGAYGALAALVIPDAFEGLGRADSVSLDPHKWLYQPTGCGCLLYRDPSAARDAFSDSGEYVRTLSADPVEGFAFFEESIELSRPFRALSLWLSLRYHGLDAFAESIAEDIRLAHLLAKSIAAEPSLEVLAPVALSAVCFRYRGSTAPADELNRRILTQVLRRGRVYISNAVVQGQFALRACVMNHRSSEEDVQKIVDEVLVSASEIEQS